MSEDVVTAEPVLVTVDDFCRELSAKDKRFELIYAFSKDEKASGSVRDTHENFAARLAAFAGRPV